MISKHQVSQRLNVGGDTKILVIVPGKCLIYDSYHTAVL